MFANSSDATESSKPSSPPSRAQPSIHTPAEESKREIHTPAEEFKRDIHTPAEESKREIHTPAEESKRDIHTPAEESKRDIQSECDPWDYSTEELIKLLAPEGDDEIRGVLEKHEIDGESFLSTTMDMLSEFGIKEFGKRFKITKVIKLLRGQSSKLLEYYKEEDVMIAPDKERGDPWYYTTEVVIELLTPMCGDEIANALKHHGITGEMLLYMSRINLKNDLNIWQCKKQVKVMKVVRDLRRQSMKFCKEQEKEMLEQEEKIKGLLLASERKRKRLKESRMQFQDRAGEEGDTEPKRVRLTN